jgi:DNA ligase (NAD+)
MSRSQAEERVADLGGAAASSISKKVDYVVAGPGAGTKLARAEKLGLAVIDEAEFQRLLAAADGA